MMHLHLENFALSDGRTVAADAECDGLVDDLDEISDLKVIMIVDEDDNEIKFDDLPENDQEEMYDDFVDQAWEYADDA